MKKLLFTLSCVVLSLISKTAWSQNIPVTLYNDQDLGIYITDFVLDYSETQSGVTTTTNYPLYGIDAAPEENDLVNYFNWTTTPSFATPYVVSILGSSYINVWNSGTTTRTGIVQILWNNSGLYTTSSRVTIGPNQYATIQIPASSKTYTNPNPQPDGPSCQILFGVVN